MDEKYETGEGEEVWDFVLLSCGLSHFENVKVRCSGVKFYGFPHNPYDADYSKI